MTYSIQCMDIFMEYAADLFQVVDGSLTFTTNLPSTNILCYVVYKRVYSGSAGSYSRLILVLLSVLAVVAVLYKPLSQT